MPGWPTRAANLTLAASQVAANTPHHTADGGTLRVKQRKTGARV
jgi:hypothetical protein